MHRGTGKRNALKRFSPKQPVWSLFCNTSGYLGKQAYDFEKRKYGLDTPGVGHTMVGWVRLQNLYDALRTCILEGVEGDFLEAGAFLRLNLCTKLQTHNVRWTCRCLPAGVWRGGASIFAAGVLRELGCLGASANGESDDNIPKRTNEPKQRRDCGMDVWLCDSFQGFEPNPWDGDQDFIKVWSLSAPRGLDHRREDFPQILA